MNKILIACPMRREAEALTKALGSHRPVIATGLRIKRSVPTLLKRLRSGNPSLLVFTGSVGQLDLNLQMGDVVLPAKWSLEDGPSFSAHEPTMRRLRDGGFKACDHGLTLDRAVMKAAQRDALCRSQGASVYDSVTAAALRVAETSNVPCITPKIVAGTVKSGLMTFWNQLDRNIQPLADYLSRILDVLAED
jgi:nucleoside phosphorylase